ncbi:MAG TPA: M14 family metallopeptidase, partial [Candidatus Acidoferrales bacterium]|nr:M14 family metallopeptidase [Candidatus Acidoferrales bacterium]
MPRYRVTITGKDYDGMADLVRKYHITVARHTVRTLAKGGFQVYAHAAGAQLRALAAAGYKIKRFEDVDKTGKQRQAEVRTAAKKPAPPRAAAAVPDRYRTVAEVESALAAAAAPPNDAFTQLISLPEKTWEERACQAIKIANGNAPGRIGIYFLGGVHAREWGSPDILMNFIEQLTQAYQTHNGITIGPKKFTAAQIQSIVNGKDVYVFPQANPDGRNYSMTKDPMWRKNRRPAPATNSKCIGVDINRNYDFLWNYPQYFAAAAPIANSLDPCNETYIGPSTFSEPETRNAAWMFDTFPNIGYFIDVHSFSEDILYSWGDDEDQSADVSMNFQNAAYDGTRGVVTDKTYKEYIPAADKATAVKLATRMRDAIKAVRGRAYKVEQSVGLYPTAGTSDDYGFSRYIRDKSKGKVYSYTIEWGSPN